MESLCGYAAEMASLHHPQYFPQELALDQNSKLIWIGPRWDLLETIVQSCPATELVQLARKLPEDPLQRIRLLRQHPSLIYDPTSVHNPVKFVETLPMGIQTRQTTQSVDINNATHVVWVLDADNDNDSTTLQRLTRLVQTRQMVQDLQYAAHVVIVAPSPNDWREALVHAMGLSSVVWVTDPSAVLPALQMRSPYGGFWKLDENLRKILLPEYSPQLRVAEIGLPCAAESADLQNCQPSIWDETVNLTRELTQDCTVVVYTAAGEDTVHDLAATEYKDDEESDELICNVALVSQSSLLVQSVIQRVPNADLVRLGVEPQPGDDPHAIHERKLRVLNGKLLYRGWILVWTSDTWTDVSLLALNSGRFWSSDVRYALYCDKTMAPSWEDTKFLIHQMQRPAWPARNAKVGSAHYRLPAEPPRRAVVLLAERHFRDKKKVKTLKKALSQWDPDGTNPTMLQRQASLYDQYDIWINRQRHQRRYYKPQEPLSYRYQWNHWVATRWILHDLKNAEASKFRDRWYSEVVHTQGSPALALVHLMALEEMVRRIEFAEPDDHTIQHKWARRMAFKQTVSDSHEWIPLYLETNRPFASVAYQLDTTITLAETISTFPQPVPDDAAPLYIRIMSDRVMAAARKSYQL